MKKSLEQLKAEYLSRPSSKAEYEIDENKYTVTRVFTEDRNLDKLIYNLAESRANREVRGDSE